MTRYFALIDGAPGAFGVVFPDLPGCLAMGDTVESAIASAVATFESWARAVKADGGAIPSPRDIAALRADPEVATALADGAALAAIPLVEGAGRKVKANLSINADILAELDASAARLNIGRSDLVEMMARRHLSELN